MQTGQPSPKRYSRNFTRPQHSDGAICVAPPNRFANPFTHRFHRVQNRWFRLWMAGEQLPCFDYPGLRRRRILMLTRMHELRGRSLACTCPAHEPCHADQLIRLASPSAHMLEKGAGRRVERLLARSLYRPRDLEWATVAAPHCCGIVACLAALACTEIWVIHDLWPREPGLNRYALRRATERLFTNNSGRIYRPQQFQLPDYGAALIQFVARDPSGGPVDLSEPRPIASCQTDKAAWIYDPQLREHTGQWMPLARYRKTVLGPGVEGWRQLTNRKQGTWRVLAATKVYDPPYVAIPVSRQPSWRYRMECRPTTDVLLPSPLEEPYVAELLGLNPMELSDDHEQDVPNAAAQRTDPDPEPGLPEPARGWDNYPPLVDGLDADHCAA